jgi:hypothetical protein
MTDQPEFDRLRQTCSARLREYITAAHETENRMQQLSMPVSLAAVRQFTSQRSAEVVAFENYMLASVRFTDFLQQHSYLVN